MATEDMKKFFPAEISANHKVHCKVFFLASMPIHKLKKDTFGFYTWAGCKVWIFDSHTTDVRNVGFIISRDPRKVDRDTFTIELDFELKEFSFSTDDADQYNEAKEAAPFDGPLPKFHLQQSDCNHSRNEQGLVSTCALTIHCQHDQATKALWSPSSLGTSNRHKPKANSLPTGCEMAKIHPT
jgi:hypothetical protein